ncbi:MAG: DUF4372 domain-containing protein [Bacteroides sp.]
MNLNDSVKDYTLTIKLQITNNDYKYLVVMLFGVLKHFDSLRELKIGMKAEASGM